MDSIIVSVSELRSRLQDIRRSGMEYVRLSFTESEDDYPACINFLACRAYDTKEWVDFDEVEALPNSEKLEEDCFYGIQMSSSIY